jgi:hypothetical protein
MTNIFQFLTDTNLSLSSHMNMVQHSLCSKVMSMHCKLVQMDSCKQEVPDLVSVLALVQELELGQHKS